MPIIIVVVLFNLKTLRAQDVTDIYWKYRERVINEFIVVSDEVEEFGTNIPAIDRNHDNTGRPVWISWSDANSNFNHWLSILSTEYRLLKNNNQDYSETLNLLVYTLFALERLDLYSEYVTRKSDGVYQIVNGDTITDYIVYPDDINGFLIRDDVSLGFWTKYYEHFGIWLGRLNERSNGTTTYRSVFQKGKIPIQGQSQDNIIRLLQGLAIVKAMCDNEPINLVNVKFKNKLIPDYLKSKDIISDDTIFIGRWVDDLTRRLVAQMQHPYPEREMVLKPLRGMAEPSKHRLFGIMSTRWYIMNPIKNELVSEGSGEDMGVWMNSFGIAEAAAAITGVDTFHFDGSRYGLSSYLFKAFLLKQLYILPGGAVPLPKSFDDYMFRDLASIADINWHKNSTILFHKLRDRREKLTYEHQVLILYLLHKSKYKNFYMPDSPYYSEDQQYYYSLLKDAPPSGPHNDVRRNDYSPYWSSSSRLIWPRVSRNDKHGNITGHSEYSGLDYMMLHNLYRLVFEPNGFKYPSNHINQLENKNYKIKSAYKPDYDALFFYEAPEISLQK
ncbi:MAG: hypothetical protein PHF99_05905 [Bacteroidales bacterium]|nr:hypothetical protein [Bacteroidales bacterium]